MQVACASAYVLLSTDMYFSIVSDSLAIEFPPKSARRASTDTCCDERSRNSENNTQKYPDIAASVPGLVKEGVQSVVLDCEAVAFERETGRILPFQVLRLLLDSIFILPQNVE